jgi:predicted dithiol-disulfide oxidoreductase (DUF899 family)
MSFEPADGVANHTYSCHQRGLEEFNVTYQLLDGSPRRSRGPRESQAQRDALGIR